MRGAPKKRKQYRLDKLIEDMSCVVLFVWFWCLLYYLVFVMDGGYDFKNSCHKDSCKHLLPAICHYDQVDNLGEDNTKKIQHTINCNVPTTPIEK